MFVIPNTCHRKFFQIKYIYCIEVKVVEKLIMMAVQTFYITVFTIVFSYKENYFYEY